MNNKQKFMKAGDLYYQKIQSISDKMKEDEVLKVIQEIECVEKIFLATAKNYYLEVKDWINKYGENKKN